MIRLPPWLPYRIRTAWDQIRVHRALRGLDRTPPVPAAAPESAHAELHMLVCRRDLWMAALAVKSLFRFEELRLAVSFTDDGSLAASDRQWLTRQVPGAKWLPRRTSDDCLRSALSCRPFLERTYRSDYHPICKLLHPLMYARCEKIVVLDPDTAFFARPRTVLDWVVGTGEHSLYLHDVDAKERTVPSEVKEAFAEAAAFSSRGRRPWRLDYYFFNSGLLLYRPSNCDLDLAERYLQWRAETQRVFTNPLTYIWFGDWTPEQTAYLMMFALMQPSATPLGEEYHLGGGEGHVFNHFMRDFLIQERTLQRLRRLVAELKRPRVHDE